MNFSSKIKGGVSNVTSEKFLHCSAQLADTAATKHLHESQM